MEATDENIEKLKQGKPVPADIAKRNLEAVIEALKFLGGKAFGAAIVDYLCRHRLDMLRSFGGDKKRLRYCVNGLLSARVNSTYFEKQVYKDNGSTKTEWMLCSDDININTLLADGNANPSRGNSESGTLSFSEDDDTERDDHGGMVNDENANPMDETTPRRIPKARKKAMFSPDIKDEEEDGFDLIDGSNGEKNRNGLTPEELDEIGGPFNEPLSSGGDAGLTYRGMIKAAMQSMGGAGTFENISKFIGIRFKDQLINKAETWKHSIAGCLSVYFARKDEKDASGKVIWSLDDPPKPKRRTGRKRERDELSNERDSFMKETRSATRRRKEEMVLISVEQLEALEEENECLKLLNVKKREEKMVESPTTTCACCHDRNELCMMLNPCGHLFCGNIFCEASTTKNCTICNVEVASRLPNHKNRQSKSLKGIFDSLANAVMSSMISPEMQLIGNNAVAVQ